MNFRVNGGAGGIRTLDTLLTYTHFPGERLRPLGHRSACLARERSVPKRAGFRKRCRRAMMRGMKDLLTTMVLGALVGGASPGAIAGTGPVQTASATPTSTTPASTTPAPAKPAPSPVEIVAAAPASDWVAIAPADLLVMTLGADARGKASSVVIQLMPPPFSQGWVGNIRKLAAAHWWDGTAIVRVQDNYVAQWGDPDGDDKAKAKPLPAGLATVPESDYAPETHITLREPVRPLSRSDITAGEGYRRTRWVPHDAYARRVGFEHGWPIGQDDSKSWPVHCYGMVGVGRNLSPDTGTGAELYTVIGHAPRHLDRNIALVGRVIEGMEHLSSLPRGHGPLGFYDPALGDERTPIISVRLASELPKARQPRFEYLSTDSASFARYAGARANRRDPFFITPAGGADICNIPVPVRRVPG